MTRSPLNVLAFVRRRRTPRRAVDPDVALVKTLRRIERSLAAVRKQTAAKADRRLALGDPGFRAALESIKGHDSTRLTRERLCTLWQAAQNVAGLSGAVAEVGSYRGGSAYFIASSFRSLLGDEVPMEVIDTFEGHPPEKLSDRDSAMHRDTARFTDTSYELVAEYLSEFEQLTVRKGEFSRVVPGLPERTYRLVHIDVDLYEPALECLRYFGPRLVTGGVIVLDDYGSPSCPGIERAAEEFLASTGAFQTWDYRKQLVLVKLVPAPAGTHEREPLAEKVQQAAPARP